MCVYIEIVQNNMNVVVSPTVKWRNSFFIGIKIKEVRLNKKITFRYIEYLEEEDESNGNV